MTLAEALTVAGVRRWLERKAPGAVVGHVGRVGACPLACYLRESGAPAAFVTEARYWLSSPTLSSSAIPLPDWAAEFVSLVDRRYVHQAITPITAAEALRALEDAEDALAEQAGGAR